MNIGSAWEAFGAIVLLAIIATLASRPQIVRDVLSGSASLIRAAKA